MLQVGKQDDLSIGHKLSFVATSFANESCVNRGLYIIFSSKLGIKLKVA